MLEVQNLCYRIRGRKTNFSIADVSFKLESGYMMWLFGRNGAGKSTLLKLLYGALKADSGNVFFQGEDICKNTEKLRRKIAYVGDEDIFAGGYSVSENAEIFGKLYAEYSDKDFLDYLKQFETDDVLGKSINELSAGQKKKVYLAFTLARHPRLLLLDEPVSNLDPIVRVSFMGLLQKLIAEEEVSVILSTHIRDDIEDIADYIGVLDNGVMEIFGDREYVMENGKNGILINI